MGITETLIAIIPGSAGIECEWMSMFGGSNSSHFVLISAMSLPWACRIIKYGQSVDVHGIKNKLEVSVLCNKRDNQQYYIDELQSIVGKAPKLFNYGHILNISIGSMNTVCLQYIYIFILYLFIIYWLIKGSSSSHNVRKME